MVRNLPKLKYIFAACALAMLFFGAVPHAFADITDPYDPFDVGEKVDPEQSDDTKTAEQLLMDASGLLLDEKLLDARTKLLKALQKDPKEYRAHMMLAGYYMQHVGHFRLALKYTKQALALFEEKNGKPPYFGERMQAEHAQLLYLLSQARLNLDNYQGALDALDEYSSYGYYASWYPGTRAWVLMKLNRVEDAIKIARLGIIAGAEPGRTYNMLGILLSMHGEPESALQVFRDAIKYELSLGTSGQPATPLNNSGEVFKEIFDENKAESSWSKAVKLPDGCEHVLPSLNLSLLYIEELNYSGAKRVMDDFDGCVAQYTVRNAEEHSALTHLARGRVDLHTGNVDSAVKHLEAALEDRQWFGKIGTSEDDLRAAAMISLAQALRAQNNHLILSKSSSILNWLADSQTITVNKIRAWWLMRKASQILTEDLSDLEDILVRNTDSMLEYPTFGELLSELPTSLLENRLSFETANEKRKDTTVYYKLWLAENYLNSYRSSEGLKLIDQVLANVRPHYDDLLKTHALVLKASQLSFNSPEYLDVTNQIFNLNRAKLRNYNLPLPVNYENLSPELITLFQGNVLQLDNSRRALYSVRYEIINNEHVLNFISSSNTLGNVKVKGNNLEQVFNNFIDAIFIEEAGRNG